MEVAMNANAFRLTVATMFGAMLTTVAAARTNYKCDDPRTPIDRRACEAAKQGPDALRRFIERMRVIESLDFHDYMTDAQLLAWREAKKRTRTAEQESR
jgi:hypothetical protein